MTFSEIHEIHKKNKNTRDNTYIVPKLSFDGFIRDELMFVEKSSAVDCTVFRSMDGKMYSLTADQVKNFKCVGSCSC